ncbi:MAG: hypothetical protein Q9227_003797 [Pyrenula ochraceoflavens]
MRQVDPEFFRRHLDLNIVPDSSNRFSSPSLPSASNNIVRLRIPTIGVRTSHKQSTQEAGLNAARAQAERGMKSYIKELRKFTADVGSSMVVRFSVHDHDFCSIEQDISITCCKVKDSWTVIAWLDSGKDLDKSLPGPWLSSSDHEYSLKHIHPLELYPVIRHHPRIGLNSHRFSRSTAAQKEASIGFQQSRSLLNENYGKTLDKATMSSDAFYSINDLFSFAAFAEVQFLNLVESVLARETGLAVLSRPPSLATLIFHKELLELHARQLRENITSLRTRGGSAWPKSTNTDQGKVARDAASLLLEDYEHLLSRCLELSALCDRGMADFNHKAALSESTRANVMAESVARLTRIATLLSLIYVPLSFTTSIFGMNFQELGQGTLKIWVWFATLCLCHSRVDHAHGISESVAGLILLGSPHPRDEKDASLICNRFKQAFVHKSKHGHVFHDGDAQQLSALSTRFEHISHRFRLLTVYEEQGTRLSMLSKKFTIVNPPLPTVDSEQETRLSANGSHREICVVPVNSQMHASVVRFSRESVAQRKNSLDRIALRRTTSFTPSEQYTVGTRDGSESTSPSVFRQLFSSSDAANVIENPLDRGQNLTSSLSMLPLYFKIPDPSPNYFARSEILRALQDTLKVSSKLGDGGQKGRNRTFALCGDVGSGKTEIAAHFVNSHKGEYDAIFWLRADDHAKLWLAYEEIASELGLQNPGRPRDMFVSRDLVRNWLTHSAYQNGQAVKWLIVFDNVESPEILKDFWPEDGSGEILLTSRHPLTKTANVFGHLGIDVEPFDTQMSVAFLTQLTKTNLGPDHTLAATRIAETLGGMPLALVSASNLINQGFLTLDDGEIDQIHRTREALTRSSQVQSNRHGVYDHVESLIFVVLDKLKHGSCLIDVLAILDPDGIKEEVLLQGASYMRLANFPRTHSAWHEAKSELLSASLISASGGVIQMHRVIQELAKVRMGLSWLKEVYEATILMFSRLWPTVSIIERHDISRWDKYAALLPHIMRLHHFHEGNVQLDLSPSSSFEFAELMNEASWYLYERGDYENAYSLSFQARAIAEVQMAERSPSQRSLDLINLLSKIYYYHGALCSVTNKRNKSFEAHSKFLDLRERLESQIPHQDELLPQALNEIGNDYMMREDYKLAESTYRASIEKYKGLKTYDSLQLSFPAGNLGLALWLQGRFDEASEVVMDALEDRERHFGRNDKNSIKYASLSVNRLQPCEGMTISKYITNKFCRTGHLLYALGNIRWSQCRFDESFDYHRRAYNQFHATIGPNHHRTCDVSCRLAQHCIRLGQFNDAISHLNVAIPVYLLKPFFKNETARTSFQKGTLLRDLGWPEAEQYLNTAVALYQELTESQKERPTMEDFDNLVMFWSR